MMWWKHIFGTSLCRAFPQLSRLIVACNKVCSLPIVWCYPTRSLTARVFYNTGRPVACALTTRAIAARAFLSIRIDGNLTAPKAHWAHRSAVTTIT